MNLQSNTLRMVYLVSEYVLFLILTDGRVRCSSPGRNDKPVDGWSGRPENSTKTDITMGERTGTRRKMTSDRRN